MIRIFEPLIVIVAAVVIGAAVLIGTLRPVSAAKVTCTEVGYIISSKDLAQGAGAINRVVVNYNEYVNPKLLACSDRSLRWGGVAAEWVANQESK